MSLAVNTAVHHPHYFLLRDSPAAQSIDTFALAFNDPTWTKDIKNRARLNNSNVRF